MAGITVKVLQCGSFGLDRDALVEGVNNLSVHRRQAPREWYLCPSFTYVIEHPDGRMLFDASIYRGWQNEWPQAWQDSTDYSQTTDEEFFESRLKQMNLDPSDFKYLFLSHLHSDHAGNARLFAGTSTQILVHENELKGVADLEADGKNAHNFFLSADYSVSGLKYTPFYGDVEIMKGIRAICLPGHTWGMTGLLIETQNCGNIILAGDAIYLKESYEHAAGAMIDYDRHEWFRSINKLRLMQKAYDAMVVPGHDHNVVHHGCSCHPLNQENKLRIWPEGYYD